MRGKFLNKIWPIFLILILCFFAFLIPDSALAQKTTSVQSGYLEKLEVNIEVVENSKVQVREKLNGLYLSYPIFTWSINAPKVSDLEVRELESLIDSSRIDIKRGDVTALEIPLAYYSNSDLELSYTIKDLLQIKDDKILLKHIIFDRPQIEIEEIEVNLVLPQESKEAEDHIRTYAIHGIEDSSNGAMSKTELWYKAKDASSLSTLTIEDQFINPNIKFPLGARLKFFFSNLGPIELLILALIFPLITLIVLFFLHLKFRQSVKVRKGLKPLSSPPDDIPPALLGLLYQGDVTVHSISATILDLIKRGLVLVVDKGDVVTFGRRIEKRPSLSFEEELLAEIFKRQKIKAELKDLKKLEEKEIIDPLFQKAYRDIYHLGKDMGYFTKNPHRTKIIHHLTGIILFLLSIIFYVLIIIFFPTKPVFILSPFGMTIGSILILRLAKIIPPRTPEGKEELERWLSFKKYLLGHHPIREETDLAIKYLPYAEVLGATDAWVNHFKKLPAKVPDFYVSSSPYTGTEEWMVKTINASREIALEIEELKGF